MSPVLALLSSAALATSPLDAFTGFEGRAWGSAPEPVMVRAEHATTRRFAGECFTVPNQRSTAGTTTLKAVRYCYWQGRLAEIQLETGPEHLEIIQEALLSKYGEPRHRPFATRWIETWSGSTIGLRLEGGYGPDPGNAVLVYQHLPTVHAARLEHDRAREEAIDAAARDL